MAHSPKRLSENKLKVARELQGLNQKQLADILGTSQPMVSSWEKGHSPGPFYCTKLSDVLGKSIEELGLLAASREESGEMPDTFSEREQGITDEKHPHLSIPAQEHNAHSYWNIPYARDTFFTGRDVLLEDIHGKLNDEETALSVVALTGLAGIGKTHVTVEYAYRFRKEYQSLFWISADNLFQEVRRLASILDLREQQEADSSLVMYAVKQWFHQSANWLIILDNVDDMRTLSEFLPQDSKGHVLLTTTLPAVGFITSSVEITPMDLKEGATFLLRRSKRIKVNNMFEDAKEADREDANIIAEELGGLALALDQAGAYIEEVPCDLSDYIERYRSRRAVFLNRRGWSSVTHKLSLATTLSLSFEKVEQHDPAAIELLRLCAFLHSNDIPEEMITEGVFFLASPLHSVAADPHLFDEAIGALRRYSLVRRRTEAKTLSLHQLVQVVLKEGMKETHQRHWAEQAIGIVSNILPPINFLHWHHFQRYVAQAQACLSLVDEYQLRSQEVARILIWVGEYLGETSHDREIESLLQKAVDLTQDLETDHPIRQASLNALGIFYFNQGHYLDAEPLLQEVIKRGRDSIDLNTATSLNNLGELYYMQARYAEAEALFLQAIEIRTRLAGAEDPLVATSLRCLAQLSMVQEEYEEAKLLFERSLSIREGVFGGDHIATADSLEGLAELYLKWHRPQDAKLLYQRAIEIYKKEQGPKHENVVHSLKGLAETYLVQEKFEEAELLFLEVLTIYDLNEDEKDVHADKAQVLKDLAWVHVYHRERITEAEVLFQEALDIRRKVMGSHPDTAASYLDLGRFYARLGNYWKAEAFYKQSLTMYVQTIGLEHPFVQRIKNEYMMLLASIE